MLGKRGEVWGGDLIGVRSGRSVRKRVELDRGWEEVVVGMRVGVGNGQSSEESGEEFEAVVKVLADM